MGFFYREAGNANEYDDKLADILQLGAPARLLQDLNIEWIVALRLSNYNPLEAKNILDNVNMKELYEAYLVYSFDKIPDDNA